jgi:hypothetical protein
MAALDSPCRVSISAAMDEHHRAMRRPLLLALILAATPALAQTQAPVTATPLAPPGMSPPPGPLTRPPSPPRGPAPVLVPVAPRPAASATLPEGPAVPISPAAPDAAPRAPGQIPIRLPDPPVPEDSPPSAFIAAARNAITAGRLGEATEAIERAETRILVRSVRPSLARTPSDQALVRQLAEARSALASGDRATALDKLTAVLRDPWLDAPPEE